MVVTIDRGQRVYLNDKPVNIHEIGQQVIAQSHNPKKQAVYVRCDETVPFGSWATVVDALRQAGIQQYQRGDAAARTSGLRRNERVKSRK